MQIKRDELIEIFTTDKRTPEERARDRIADKIRARYHMRYSYICRQTFKHRFKMFICRLLSQYQLRWYQSDWYPLPQRAVMFCKEYAKRQPLVIKWIDHQEQHCLSGNTWFCDEDGNSTVAWQKVYFDPKSE